MEPKDGRFENDAFTPIRLPIARRHLPRTGRGRLFAGGAIAAVVVAIPFLGDAFLGRATTVSNGPLSASHALFGAECGSCHTPGVGVPDAKCASCHERAGDPVGVYSFARHYLYRSADFDRSAPSSKEGSCASCHVEHRGRETPLERVADARCDACHDIASLRAGHPEFDFAADAIAERSNLRFTHVQHVREVIADERLTDTEAACLRCHEPDAAGRAFQPLDFARHCDACHLTASTATAFLDVADGAGPGVQTLEAIRGESGPAAAAAEYWDPGEFRLRGEQIQKRPVYHEDPWILYNLGRLRAQLYPGAPLADLVRASADVPPGQDRLLQQEAVATLRARIQVLRGEPSRDVQRELRQLEELLAMVERRWDDPYAPVDATRFDIGVADRAPGLDSGELDEAAFLAVVDSLTAPCQVCHHVDQATIQRVQKDQRTLVRAEFDHRSHIIHARCLDCHEAIPIRDWVGREEDVPPALDHAAIQNLPAIASCRGCHRSRGAPDQCTTCHRFHPDTAYWSNLSRFRQTIR